MVLDPSATDGFLRQHARGPLPDADRQKALALLEMQRAAMLMFTSCGWFFDELSGLEPLQILRYAGRAAQLARQATGDDLEPALLARLAQARSNLPDIGDARRIYESRVSPMRQSHSRRPPR